MAADGDAVGRGPAGVDEPEPDALAATDFELGRGLGEAAVDGQAGVGRDDAPHHPTALSPAALSTAVLPPVPPPHAAHHPAPPHHPHPAVAVLDQLAERPRGVHQHVVEDEDVLAVVLDVGRRLLDDERAEEAPVKLETLVAVVHVAPGGRRLELVDHPVARRDRLLCQARHTVHRVRDGDAVPVDRCAGTGEVVLDGDPEPLALADADLGAGVLPVVAPGPQDPAGGELDLDRPGHQADLAHRAADDRLPGRECGRGAVGVAARGEQGAADRQAR